MTDTATNHAGDAISQPPPHVVALATLMDDGDFLDFITNAFGQCCDSAGRASLNPVHYFTLTFFGFFEGCRSDRDIHERAGTSKQILQLLDLEIDDPAPSAEALAHTRQVLGPKAHAAVAAWVVSTTEWGGAAPAIHHVPQISISSFLEYLKGLENDRSLAGEAHGTSKRTARTLENRLSPALLKTVFTFASNLVTTGFIAAFGIWLLGFRVPAAPEWSPSVSLAVLRTLRATAAVTLLLGLLLVALLLFDARRRVRELSVPEPLRTVLIVVLATIIVLVMALATLKQAGGG